MNKKKIIIAFFAVPFIIGSVFFSNGIEPEILLEKYATPESKFIEIDGQKVHYRDTGKGEVLLLLHGVSSSLHTWDGWQTELSKDFRVISLDLPAFGITGPFPNDDYNFAHYMVFLESFMDKLGVEKCYLSGNSFGGNLTWRFASKNPDRVIKIAILDASGFERSENPIGFILTSTPGISIVSHYFTPKFLIENSVKGFYGEPSMVTDSLVNRYYELLLRKGNRQAFSKVLNQLEDNKEQLPSILSTNQNPNAYSLGRQGSYLLYKSR